MIVRILHRGKIESGELPPGAQDPQRERHHGRDRRSPHDRAGPSQCCEMRGLAVTTPGRGTHVVKRLSLDKQRAHAPVLALTLSLASTANQELRASRCAADPVRGRHCRYHDRRGQDSGPSQNPPSALGGPARRSDCGE